jgi:hypothetical protein
MPSCPWEVCGGALEADLWDFCGARRRPSAADVTGYSETWDSSFEGRFAAEPVWLASR